MSRAESGTRPRASPRGLRHREEVIAERDAVVRRRRPVPGLDEDILTVRPGVPGPAEIAQSLPVRPGQHALDIRGRSAHGVADLPDEQWNRPRHAGDVARPALAAVAPLRPIAVPSGDEL